MRPGGRVDHRLCTVRSVHRLTAELAVRKSGIRTSSEREWTAQRGVVMSKGASHANAEFEALYRVHHREVLAYCARRASRADAWDAAAEVFVVAWRRMADVPPAEEARAWLLGVAFRVLANQRRSAARKRRLAEKMATTDATSGFLADEPIIRSEEQHEVVEALSRLRPLDREILQLSLWEELSPVEIAELLDISRDAVDKRFSRAKGRLAREFDRHTVTSGNATQTTAGGGGAA